MNSLDPIVQAAILIAGTATLTVLAIGLCLAVVDWAHRQRQPRKPEAPDPMDVLLWRYELLYSYCRARVATYLCATETKDVLQTLLLLLRSIDDARGNENPARDKTLAALVRTHYNQSAKAPPDELPHWRKLYGRIDSEL